MNELQRMQYLDAMGLDTFVPRYILPVAKAPSQCDLPIAPAPQDPVVADKQNPSNTLTSSAAQAQLQPQTPGEPAKAAGPIAQNILAQVQTEAAEPSVAETKPSGASPEPEAKSEKPAAPPVEFSLAMWRVSEAIFVIDTRRQGDALPTQALLNNMMTSMGLLSAALPREEILNWPVVKGEHDQSWQAASQMVQGFLDARLLAKPVTTFLLFGEDASRAVLGEGFDFKEMQHKDVTVEDYAAKGLVLPSLADLLYAPELKRDVWLALSSFLPSESSE